MHPLEQNEKLQELRDLYAQGPEVGRAALEKLTPVFAGVRSGGAGR